MANQTLQLADLLRREGSAVELVEVNPPYRPRWIGHVPGVRAACRLVPYAARIWSAAGRAEVAHVMASSGWAWHLFAAPAVWLASLRRVPVIVNYRGGGAGEFFARSMPWIRPTLARCAAIVVPSPFLDRIFRRHGFQTSIVPNIIDLARFSPQERTRGPGGTTAAAPHLVVARNLEPVYDVGTALRAFRIVRDALPGARLSIAGSGPALGSLEALSRELGIQGSVAFTGRIENREMAALYHDADLSLNPSLADNMPISVLESLASGVPVVSTNVGGIPDLVADGVTASLVPPGDPAAMAAAALDLLSDAERWSRQRRAGIDHVRGFTWEAVRERLLATYRDAARRGLSSPARSV
jgi:glycosyltransferase involved in cell wall biosynthesis